MRDERLVTDERAAHLLSPMTDSATRLLAVNDLLYTRQKLIEALEAVDRQCPNHASDACGPARSLLNELRNEVSG